jgi:hypothetical protein
LRQLDPIIAARSARSDQRKRATVNHDSYRADITVGALRSARKPEIKVDASGFSILQSPAANVVSQNGKHIVSGNIRS